VAQKGGGKGLGEKEESFSHKPFPFFMPKDYLNKIKVFVETKKVKNVVFYQCE
jgi:hypothetical protein